MFLLRGDLSPDESTVAVTFMGFSVGTTFFSAAPFPRKPLPAGAGGAVVAAALVEGLTEEVAVGFADEVVELLVVVVVPVAGLLFVTCP